MAISNELRRLVDPNNECCCEYCFSIKCKEWANTQDYWTQSGYEINHLGNYFCMIKDMPDNQFFYADTEIEAIFLASEYILNNIKQ